MLIFDEKAKEHRVVKHLANVYGRLEDVVEIGKPHGKTFNLISTGSRKQFEKQAKSFIKESHEPFWRDGAVNLIVDVAMFLIGLKELHAFAREECGVVEDYMRQSTNDNGSTFTLDIPIAPLTMKELGGYLKNLKNYVMLIGSSQKYIDSLERKILAKIGSHVQGVNKLQTKLAQIDTMVFELKVLAKSLKEGKVKLSDGEASGMNGLLFSANAGISPLMFNPYSNNAEGSDIAEMLNDGKIVVINTESFDDTILFAMMDQTLNALSLRAKKKNPKPIAIIIDEANRILTSSSDLKTDVLRESKVDVIVAVQNHEQMIRKMGKVEWSAMMQNFTTQINFQGQSETSGVFNAVDEIAHRTCAYEASFFLECELDQSELLYQNAHGFYKSMQMSDKDLLIYDHSYLESKKMLIFRNLITQEEREVRYLFKAPGHESRLIDYNRAINGVRESKRIRELKTPGITI